MRVEYVTAVPVRSTNEVKVSNAVGRQFVLHQTAALALIIRKASQPLSTHLLQYSHSGPITR